MWLFKKEPINKTKLVEKTKLHEVGRTFVKVDLEDGNTVTVIVEGEVSQVMPGSGGYPGPVTTLSSDFIARDRLRFSSNGDYICDYREPETYYYSKPKKATILFTEKFQKEFTEYAVEMEG